MNRLLKPETVSRAGRAGGLTNQIIIEDFRASSSFMGVFSVDDVPHTTLKQHHGRSFNSCILNLSKAGTEGTHFVSLIVYPGKKTAHYLDPSGMPPFQELMDKLLFKRLKCADVQYNGHKFQKRGSSLCAYYCMYFILWYEARATRSQVLKQLTSYDGINNDKIVIKNLKLLASGRRRTTTKSRTLKEK